jgi:hypothetical protein
MVKIISVASISPLGSSFSIQSHQFQNPGIVRPEQYAPTLVHRCNHDIHDAKGDSR